MDYKDQKRKLFYSLERLLKRSSLSEEVMPSMLDQWKDFLSRLNNSFYDMEQERYLLERSMELSSHELVALNERFEVAESIAHIGHWFFYSHENKVLWSQEMYRIFGVNPAEPALDFQHFIMLVHEDYRNEVTEAMRKVLAEGVEMGIEYRLSQSFQKNNGESIWVYTKCVPTFIKDNAAQNHPWKYNLSGIVIDITERKNAEINLAQANKKLVEISRRAGMSEIATAVLHNIGNILNSLNLSTMLVQEKLSPQEINNIHRASQMICDNLKQNERYLIDDEKGKLIPVYLKNISEKMQMDYESILKEFENINRHIDHIKEIVSMQNNISGVSVVKEKIQLNALCDQAIQMTCYVDANRGLKINRHYQDDIFIFSDKSKLLQIIVNLISNAKDALKESKNALEKYIHVSISYSEDRDYVAITIEDNGVGIEISNLKKIFSMGYTTKPSGHGFGLHTSANSARELGGSLSASSEGIERGAKFLLLLPLSEDL